MALTYHYVPAALGIGNLETLTLWIKYRQHADPTHFSANLIDPYTCHVITPDRELFYSMRSHYSDWERPIDGDWDECLLLSPYHASWRDTGIKFFMKNAAAIGGEKTMFNPAMGRPGGITAIGDSGGFQLITGVEDFINPVELGTWSANNVDICMALDIPFMNSHELLKRSAEMQKRNSDTILDIFATHGNRNELFNIVHGATGDESKRFHDIVFDSRIKRLAMSDVNINTHIQRIDLFGRSIESNRSHYQHFHMLGISDRFFPLFFMRLLHQLYGDKKDILLTSDSITPIQQGRAFRWGYTPNLTKPFNLEFLTHRKTHLDTVKDVSLLGHLLVGSSPVVQSTKWGAVFSRCDPLLRWIIFHNAMEIGYWMQNCLAMAKGLDDKQFRDYVLSMARNEAQKVWFRQMHDYIKEIVQNGFDKAKSKYTVFATNSLQFQVHDEETEKYRQDYTKRISKVLDNFDHFYKGNVVVKSKEKIRAAHGKKGGPTRTKSKISRKKRSAK